MSDVALCSDMVVVISADSNEAEVVQRALAPFQVQVVLFESGQRALTYLDRIEPGVIILSCNTLDHSGIDVLRELRQNTFTATKPVIMVQSPEDRRTYAQAVGFKVKLFLQPGFDEESLLAEVRKVAMLSLSSSRDRKIEQEVPERSVLLGVIDDELTSSIEVSLALPQTFYNVQAVRSLDQSWAQEAMSRANCLLVKLSAFGCKGVELLERLNNDPALDNIPVIALTERDFQLQQDALGAGASGVISYPPDPLMLRTILSDILGLWLLEEFIEEEGKTVTLRLPQGINELNGRAFCEHLATELWIRVARGADWNRLVLDLQHYPRLSNLLVDLLERLKKLAQQHRLDFTVLGHIDFISQVVERKNLAGITLSSLASHQAGGYRLTFQ